VSCAGYKSYVKLITLCAMILLSTLACEDVPRRDYEDFKARAEGLRLPPPELSDRSEISDITGLWLINARLSAGIDLGLRVRFSLPEGVESWPEDANGLQPVTLQTTIWLERQNPNDPEEQHVVQVNTNVGADGRFVLVADPLILDPESLGLASAVEAIVNLNTKTLDANELCGEATGEVTKPIVIDLEGSTFFGARDDELTLTLSELPGRCPASGDPEGGAQAGGTGGADGGADGGVEGGTGGAEVTRPESPDLSAVTTQLGDITGHWLVNVKTSILPLKLWASLIYTPAPEATGGYIEGSLRRDTDAFDAPPLATISASVDAEGRFEIWLPGLQVLTLSADLLITAAILPPAEGEARPVGWCGAGAGMVGPPFNLDLAGSTLYAHPWVPGSPEPVELFEACPE